MRRGIQNNEVQLADMALGRLQAQRNMTLLMVFVPKFSSESPSVWIAFRNGI